MNRQTRNKILIYIYFVLFLVKDKRKRSLLYTLLWRREHHFCFVFNSINITYWSIVWSRFLTHVAITASTPPTYPALHHPPASPPLCILICLSACYAFTSVDTRSVHIATKISRRREGKKKKKKKKKTHPQGELTTFLLIGPTPLFTLNSVRRFP